MYVSIYIYICMCFSASCILRSVVNVVEHAHFATEHQYIDVGADGPVHKHVDAVCCRGRKLVRHVKELHIHGSC